MLTCDKAYKDFKQRKWQAINKYHYYISVICNIIITLSIIGLFEKLSIIIKH